MADARPAPPPRRTAPPPTPATATQPANPNRFAVITGRKPGPQRVVIYGPGGIGKTSLAAHAPNPVFLDIESGTRELDVARVEDVESFADLRACLQSSVLDGFQTVVVDSVTRVEEWATAYTLQTVKTERGETVTSLESYGFGKGYQHVYDTFLLFLADCDRQVRAGRNVILIAHDCTTDVPNPMGENFIRFEPHLQAPKSGKASIRNRVVQWADHVLFLGYDVLATKDGKGKGGGTRTIYPMERPDHIAKSRILSETMPFEHADDNAVWGLLFAQGGVR